MKTVFFDSSVLINLHKEKLQDALRDIISYYLPVDEFMSDYAYAFKELQAGLIDSIHFLPGILKNYKLPIDTVNKIIAQHDGKRKSIVSIDNDVKGVIDALVSDGYSLGIISSMPKEWFLGDALRLGINPDNFSFMIFTGDLKTSKDDIKVFKKARKCSKGDCFYVTNHEAEVELARSAGFIVISLGNESGDLSIDSIPELIDVLNNEEASPKQRHETPVP